MASKAARKAIYFHKVLNHFKNKTQNTHLIIITANNLTTNQTRAIRQDLQSHSTLLMGKNTLMKHSIAIHAPATQKHAFVGAIPHIAGKVGLVLTDSDPEEVSEAVAGYKLQPLVCSSMDIGMCDLWQWLLGFHLDLVNKSTAV
ncbi:hypothetical protein QVD17_32264 [Tagetes erecta]|uniref:Uncharacterized protein n=1 Tax=Tagetes erecta TaxID=13708 RepID=A0AAD8K5W4_TARER|nr:hypothetical protein QVD17_32264 [Tagetes erecta]